MDTPSLAPLPFDQGALIIDVRSPHDDPAHARSTTGGFERRPGGRPRPLDLPQPDALAAAARRLRAA